MMLAAAAVDLQANHFCTWLAACCISKWVRHAPAATMAAATCSVHFQKVECACGCRVFGTVSYYVQKLFSEFQGVWYVETSVSTPEGDPHDHGVAASATCQDDKCTQLAFKVRTSLQTSPSDAYMTTALLMKRHDVLAAHSAGRQVSLGMVPVSGMVSRLVLPVGIACG